MKIIYCILTTVLICLSSLTGCVSKQHNQLLGRAAKESPSLLQPGLNKVSFFSQGTRIVGNVFLPPDYSIGQLLPSLIMVAPESGIKEQSPGNYALIMSFRGFLTLVFDHRSFGESDGEPRLLSDLICSGIINANKI